MAELKTQENDASVEDFLNGIPDERKRADAFKIMQIMQEISGEPPRMWGDSIVGYGHYHYRYASGRTGEWPLVAFSPRKQNLTLYIMSGFDQYDELRAALGKHKVGKSCLYINKLADVDEATLREMVRQSVDHMRATNP